ncbi:glycosyltransferase family 4 protein [Candidatus Saccharibacteria bacterium]|nr:glycosyltransferase family 4 protein [Candidatus Saccharibacteria bacterium]
MKIAFFSDCYLDLSGGIVSTINAEKAELERQGHTVCVFSSAYPHSEIELKKLTKQHIYPVPSCRILGRGIAPISRRPGVVVRWLQKNHPELKSFDCFYIHYEAGCSIAGLRLAHSYRIPAIQVMHGREDSGVMTAIPFGFRTITATALNFIHSWYVPHTIKIHKDNYLATTTARAKMWTMMINHANYADLVLTPSEHFCKKLIHYGVTVPILSLHHGISDQFFAAKPMPKSFIPGETLEIIWHSRVQGEKRILPFLKALTMVKGKYHLDVYGDGFDLPKAKKYARRHKLNVTFNGEKSFNTVRAHLEKAHLDVLVSYNYDTFGMSLLEAAVTATPTIIVDPDLTEILPKGSYLLTDGPEPEQMATAINSIFKNPDKVHTMSAKLASDGKFTKVSDKVVSLVEIMKKLQKSID